MGDYKEYKIGNEVIITNYKIADALGSTRMRQRLFVTISRYLNTMSMMDETLSMARNLSDDCLSRGPEAALLESEIKQERKLLAEAFIRAQNSLKACDEACETNSINASLESLKAHVSKYEAIASDTVKKFRQKDIDIGTFIAEYTRAREKYHEYSAKLLILKRKFPKKGILS